MSASTLVGNYKVKSFNGNKLRRIKAELTAGEEGEILFHTVVVNSISGTLHIVDGNKLQGQLVSTLMMGEPELMEVEQFLSAGFNDGLTFSRVDRELTLTDGKNTLVLRSRK